MLGRDTLLTRQPWVRQPGSLSRWEPEPLRWLGYNAIINSFVREDRTLNNPPARRGDAVWPCAWPAMEGLMQ
jgi:hypothetical protein